jgi:hypothetical protein
MNWNCVAPAYTVVSHCAGLASTTPHTRLRVRFIKERPLAFSARPANLTSARCSYIRTHLTAFWLDFITTTLQLEASKETNGSLIIVIIPGHQQIHTMLLALSWLHHKQVPNTGIIKPYAVMFLTLTVNTTVITPDHTPSAQSGPYITLPHCTHIRCRLLPRYIQQFITTHAQEPSHKKKNTKPYHRVTKVAAPVHTVIPLNTGFFPCWLDWQSSKSKRNFAPEAHVLNITPKRSFRSLCHGTVARKEMDSRVYGLWGQTGKDGDLVKGTI